MLLEVPGMLNGEQLDRCRRVLAGADWADGRATAGHLSAEAKDNSQLPTDSAPARQLGELVLDALSNTPLFISAALPLKVFPPLFNRYAGGQSFGAHVDNAIRQIPGSGQRVRTDLSMTIFISDPEDYDGGELSVADTYGTHEVKLAAGSAVLYPATSLHRVRPVTRGARLASFLWVQSMVRDERIRAQLFDLDTAIQRVGGELPGHPSLVQLTAVYHNLLRIWADA